MCETHPTTQIHPHLNIEFVSFELTHSQVVHCPKHMSEDAFHFHSVSHNQWCHLKKSFDANTTVLFVCMCVGKKLQLYNHNGKTCLEFYSDSFTTYIKGPQFTLWWALHPAEKGPILFSDFGDSLLVCCFSQLYLSTVFTVKIHMKREDENSFILRKNGYKVTLYGVGNIFNPSYGCTFTCLWKDAWIK